MLFPASLIRISDNSGGKFLKIIRIVHKGSYGKKGVIGDICLGSIKQLRNRNRLLAKVRKGDLVYAVIIKTKKTLIRSNGLTVYFSYNAAVLLTKQNIPIGSRIFTGIPLELRSKKFAKVISLATGFI